MSAYIEDGVILKEEVLPFDSHKPALILQGLGHSKACNFGGIPKYWIVDMVDRYFFTEVRQGLLREKRL